MVLQFETWSEADRPELTASAPPWCDAAADEGQDSRSVSYILKVRPGFDALRHAAAQLAAFLVLATTGSHAAGPDHPLVGEARRSFAEARDRLGVAGAVTMPAQHHRHHLARAMAAIGSSLAVIGQGKWLTDSQLLDLSLKQLQAGWQELHWASSALPGFDLVQLDQSCCAGHAFRRPGSQAN